MARNVAFSASTDHVPEATIRPASIRWIASQRRTVVNRCAMMTTVIFRSSSSMARSITDSVIPSSALVASSRMRTFASRYNARAIPMRWRWPPAQPDASFADHGIVAVRREDANASTWAILAACDKTPSSISRSGTPIAMLRRIVVEQKDLLGHVPDIGLPRPPRFVAKRNAVNLDCPR